MNFIAPTNKALSLVGLLLGVVTWFILNRKPIRGDYAALLYLLSFALSYILNCYIYHHHSSGIFEFWAVLTSSACLTTALYRLSPLHPLFNFPGPFWWRISSLRLAYVSSKGTRHLILHDLHNKYGQFMRIGPDVLSVNSAKGLQTIYCSNSMEKSDAYITPGHLDAVALFFKQSSKDIHSRRKRIWSAAFTGSNISQFIPPLDSRTWQLIQCIERRKDKDNVVDLSTCIAHWAYDFMAEMVFGGATKLELMRDGDPKCLLAGLKTAATVLDSFGQVPWLMDIIWHLPFGSSMHQIRHRAAEMMRQRQSLKQKIDVLDLASYLLSGDPSTGYHLPQADLDLEAVVAIQGGSDNTAIILSLAFYYLLSRHPSQGQTRYYDVLYAELQAEIPNPKYLDTYMHVLGELPILNGVINEALRLGSPFYLPRIVPSGGAEVAGRFIPGGTIVASAAYSQQIDEENFWPAPLEFRPERWCPGELGKEYRTNKSALASFSSGPHSCVAKTFAYQELRFVIARLVLTFDMWVPDRRELFDPEAFEEGVMNMRTTVLGKPLLVGVSLRR